MRTAWKGILGGAALLGLIAVPALAQGPGGGGRGRGGFRADGPRGGGRIEMAARVLGLSADQKAAAEKLQQQHRAEIQPLIEQERRLRQEVRTALDSGTPDATQVGEKMIASHQLMEKLRAARKDFEDQFDALLTPAQRETLKTLREARERMRGARRGPGGRGFGPGPGLGPDDPPGPPPDDTPQL